MSRPHHSKAVPGAKARDMKGALLQLLRYCKPYHTLILLALLCAGVSTVLMIIGPDKLSELTDLITQGLMTGLDMGAINAICFTLVAYYGTSAVMGFIQGQLMTYTNQKISKSLRSSISVKMNRLPMDYFHKTSHGDVLSRVTNDVDMIGETLQRSVVQLVSAAALLLGSLWMMFTTNAWMAITAIVASLIGFVFMMGIMAKSQKYFIRRQEWLGKINGHIEETYTGHNIIKAYNAEQKVSQIFDQMNEELYASNWKSQFLSGLMMPVMGFIGNFGYVSVCVVGAALAMNGSITFGVIVAFMIYVRLFTNPLSQIAQAATSLQSTAAAAERVFDFVDAKEMEDETHKTKELANPRGEVEFDHIQFSYIQGQPIIHDFSEHIQPGQKIAIVGPTGAGKTTLVNLLMRFYELDAGQIRIDGIPTQELKRETVHQLFGMVLQDTWMFEGTVKENIVYCKENVSDEQVIAACKAVGLHHFVCTLPKGYDTVLDDKINLSAGQKQLLTIARAMVQDAPMLILDEATSSVDTRTEVLIQQAMDRLTQGRTSFVIAHRLSTIRNADKILVMKNGDIVESGNHEELMAQNGFYADLYNSQFEQAS